MSSFQAPEGTSEGVSAFVSPGGSGGGHSYPDAGRQGHVVAATPPRGTTHHQQSSTTSSNSSNYVQGFDVTPDSSGVITERWDYRLPRPASNPVTVEDKFNPDSETVCVYNVNTREGTSMVRVLSENKINVVGVVKVFNTSAVKQLLNLRYVTMVTGNWMDLNSLVRAGTGCQKAFFVTKYWEKFESRIEETMVTNVLLACREAGIPSLVLANFESTMTLRTRRMKSQLMPDKHGRIYPKFKGMKRLYAKARECGVQVTNMMTSYYDDDDDENEGAAGGGAEGGEGTRRSLVLIRPPNGKIIVESHFPDL